MNGAPPAVGLAAQDWTPATTDEVYLAFLRAEWTKVPEVTSWNDRRLIDHPDLSSPYENTIRRLILARWREPLLQRIPGNTQWYRVRFLTDDHLDELLVISSADWVDPHDHNELRTVSVRRPQILRTPPADWPNPVLWSHVRGRPFSIIEGNNRLTAYCCTPALGPLRVECFIGLSPDLCIWHLPDHG